MAPTRILVFFIYAFCIPSLAYAYVDPGSGMLMLQGLIAAAGACLFAIRNPRKFLGDIKERLRRKRQR